MNAVEVVRMAEASGVRLGVEGADLILDADLEPPVDVVNAIRRHKAEIIEILAPLGDKWTAEDWRALFEGRAGVAEHDRELSRTEALAYESCIVVWLNRNPPSENGPECCVQCGNPMDDLEALPFLTGDGGHVWMHDYCHTPWMRRRRAEAADALGRMGVAPPSI